MWSLEGGKIQAPLLQQVGRTWIRSLSEVAESSLRPRVRPRDEYGEQGVLKMTAVAETATTVPPLSAEPKATPTIKGMLATDPYTVGIMAMEAARARGVSTAEDYRTAMIAMPGDSLKWFRTMEEDGVKGSISTYLTLMDQLAQEGEKERCEDVFRLLQERKGTQTVFYNALIKAYGTCGDVDSMYRLFHRMKDAGLVRVDSYNSMMGVLSRRGSLTLAASLFESMKNEGYKPDQITYSTLLWMYVRGRDTTNSGALYREAESLGLKDHACTSAMLTLYSTLRNVKSMAPYLSELLEDVEGLDPRNTTSIFRAVTLNGRMDWAEDVYRLLDSKGVRIPVTSFTRLIRGYATQRDASKFDEVIARAERHGHRMQPALFNALLHGYLYCGKTEFAQRLWMEFPMHRNEAAYRMYLDYMARTGGIHEVSELVNRINANKVAHPKSTMPAHIRALAEDGRIMEAKAKLMEMTERKLQPMAADFSVVIDEAADRGCVDIANDLLAEMHRLKLDPSIKTYLAIIKCHGQTGQTNRIWSVLKEMSDRCIDFPMRLFTEAARHFARNGDFNWMNQQLDQAIAAGFKPDRRMLRALADAFIVQGNRQGIPWLMEVAKEHQVDIDGWLLAPLIDHLSIEGDVDAVQEALDNIPMEKRVFYYHVCVVRAFSRMAKGNVKTAMKEELEEKARQGYEQAMELIKTARDEDVVKLMVARPQNAMRIFQVVKKPAASIIYTGLVQAFCEMGTEDSLERAKRLVQKLLAEGVVPHVEVFRRLMMKLIRRDGWESTDALNLFSRMIQAGPAPFSSFVRENRTQLTIRLPVWRGYGLLILCLRHAVAHHEIPHDGVFIRRHRQMDVRRALATVGIQMYIESPAGFKISQKTMEQWRDETLRKEGARLPPEPNPPQHLWDPDYSRAE